jgi:ParB/RepB/Spo0J family partition protein
MTTQSATTAAAAAAATVSKRKSPKVSHAKQEQTALPLPVNGTSPEFGELEIGRIAVLDQVRTEFDEASLAELAADIADRGILQPLTVRTTPDGYVWILVAGERRLRAAKIAGLKTVPVLITTMTEDEHHAAQLAENIQREDLSTLDEAKAIRALHDLGKSVSDIMNLVHKSKSWISKRLAAAHPSLSWQARGLLEDGSTEDLELVLAVDAVAKLDYCDGNDLARKVRNGTAGRETARETLATVKERVKGIQEARAANQAKLDDPEEKAKREQRMKEDKARWEAIQEQQRLEFHINTARQFDNFWDWCADNPNVEGSAWLTSRTREQIDALMIDLKGWYESAAGMTAEQLAERALFEFVRHSNDVDGMHPHQFAALKFGMGKPANNAIDLQEFFDWYKGRIILPIQAEARENDE